MKVILLVLVSILFLAGNASAQFVKPTPAPVPTVHRHKHKAVIRKTDDTDDGSSTPKPNHAPLKSKSVKKVTTNDDADVGNKPTPTPEPTAHPSSKKKVSKKAADDNGNDDEAKPSPTSSPEETPHPSSRKKIHKKAVDDDETTQGESSPTPSVESTPAPSAPKTGAAANSAPDASLTSDEIVEFDKQPAGVQKLLESALALTRDNLTYTYGSADPANGGMDCSGFVYYVLRENGFNDVPRDASGQYVWVRKAKTFQAVLSKRADSFELADLHPGDLLFWTGTYASEKDPPITHTMIYLGTEKGTHKGVMVGSTDGRSYEGKSRWGVSVFDFKANASVSQSDPAKQTHAAFVGYARIPGLRGE